MPNALRGPMPNAQCPARANALCQIVPHVTEKGYNQKFKTWVWYLK